ncbi:MAG: acetylglutamate kinase [Planctomycetes bacterium]|nr:acetylglutamate kinase [Planctomycetota bacterium]MCG2685106.1 acetylglutamate kinase [Planctomycetales bacterium]
MEEAIQKADVLIEALQWIRQFRGKITVIKLGGSIMEDQRAMVHLLLDIVFMETVGMRPVVVHGGGPAINRAMDAAGLQPRFVRGRRHTDADTLAVVERVLAGEVNRKIAQQINDLGGQARSLSFGTKNVLFGRHASVHDERGTPLDLGYVGVVTRVDRDSIVELCNAGVVPVIPSMCVAEDDQKLNVNADTAATAVAQALEAEKLVYLSDINGVRRKKNDPDSLIHSLTAEEALELISDGSIDAGMIPKVQACLETLDRGVHKVHIIDGRLRHSLLLEVYTNKGVGTQIVRD